LIVWEFRARRGREREFEKVYGTEGDWARYFKPAKGYRGTQLFRDRHVKRRYLTLDFWVSRAAFEWFRRRHLEEYKALDLRCESLSEREGKLGTFLRPGRDRGLLKSRRRQGLRHAT